MKYLTFFILAFFISLSFGLRAQVRYPSFDKLNSVNEARADINFINNLLEKEHPNLYRYVSKAVFKKKIDSLKRSINKPLTNVALRNAILSVLTTIGNGHLSLLINVSNAEATAARTATLKTYPIERFNYQVLQGRLFISGATEPDAMIAPGAEILSINGITATKMLADFFTVIPSDGYNQSLKIHLLNQGLIPDLFTQFYGREESLSFRIKVNDSTRLVKVNAVPVRKAIPFKTGNVVSNFKLLPNASAYLKVEAFNEMPYGAAGEMTGLKPFTVSATNSQSPYLSLFQRLSSSGTTSLILDLRNNMGGEYLTAAHLFSYLINRPSLFAKVPEDVLNNKLKTPDQRLKYGSATPVIPQPLRFKGTLYVLINGGTFSAASLLAANLQAMGRAVIIGEESGGGRNYLTGGLITEAIVPNSHLILRFGNIAMETPLLQKTEGRGVMPDQEVSYTIREYLSGQDKELEWVKNEIAMRSKK